MKQDITSRAIVSLLSSDGSLSVGLDEVVIGAPGRDEVTVRIEATPVHPSNIGLLFGPLDLTSAVQSQSRLGPQIMGRLSPSAMAAQKGRLDQAIIGGAEGAGTVVRTGAGCERLAGRRVAIWGAPTYTEYQTISSRNCMVLPDDVTMEQGAAAFINPMTVLGLVETMKRDGRSGLVNTAAASTVGRMLLRLCLRDGIPLVNIVRRTEQAEALYALGATHVVDSSSSSFEADLTKAIDETGAMVGFDAIGGAMTGKLLACMEASAVRRMVGFSRYGSPDMKRCYVYGGLDMGPVEIPRQVGLAWQCRGWLLHHFLATLDEADSLAFHEQVRANLTTVFATSYTRTINLAEALDIEVAREFSSRGTGSKVLIAPFRS